MVRIKYFILFFIFLSVSQKAISQSLCRNIYVWDFTWDDDKKQNTFTKQITFEIESSLTRNTHCTVLQRRSIASLMQQTENEKAFARLFDEISPSNQKTLKTKGAEIVVFGEIRQDIRSDVTILKLTFQNIDSKSILYSQSYFLTRVLINDPHLRADSLDIFIRNCIDNTFNSTSTNINDEESIYNLVKSSNTIESCDLYIEKYPNGKFIQVVNRIKKNLNSDSIIFDIWNVK